MGEKFNRGVLAAGALLLPGDSAQMRIPETEPAVAVATADSGTAVRFKRLADAGNVSADETDGGFEEGKIVVDNTPKFELTAEQQAERQRVLQAIRSNFPDATVSIFKRNSSADGNGEPVYLPSY